jgi:hypothetical protein
MSIIDWIKDVYNKTPIPEIREAMRAGRYRFNKGISTKSKESVSYLKTKYGYQTTYKLRVQDGFASRFNTNQLIDFMPIDVPENIKIRFSTREKMLRDKGRDKLIENGENFIFAQADFGSKKGVSDGSDELGNQMESDVELYGRLRKHNANPLIIFDWTLIVNSKSQMEIDEFVENINKAYTKNKALQGLEWQTIAGKQKELWGSIFGKINLSNANLKFVNTDVIKYHSSVPFKYARLNTVFSRGLKYDSGLVVGYDVTSPISETARIDFLKTIKSKAIIAIDKDRGTYEGLSASSVILQTIANQFAAANVPTIHIVLNGFDYINSDTYLPEAQKHNNLLFENVEMNKYTINPMEGYRLPEEDISTVHKALIRKISDMIQIMLKYDLPESYRIEIESLVSDFYVKRHKWNADGVDDGRIDIANIKDHATYPTMGGLVEIVRSSLLEKNSLESTRERLDIIVKGLTNELTENKNTIGSTSTIKPPVALQTYYNFSYLKGNSKDLELLNVLDYAMHYALLQKANIMIHGLNEVDERMVNMMSHFSEYAKEHDIPVVIGMDTVLSKKVGNKTIVGVDSLHNVWYNHLTEAEVFAFSRLSKEEFVRMEDLLQQKFSVTTKDIMTEDVKYTFYSIYEDRNTGIVSGVPMI